MRLLKNLTPLFVLLSFFTTEGFAQLEADLEARLDTDNIVPGEVNPGDVLEFTLTVRNTGATPITGIRFQDLIDPNATLLGSEGRAVDDEYLIVGSGDFSIPAPSGVIQKNDFGSELSVTSADSTTLQGQTVTVAPDGSFTYSSNGYNGKDSFQYTVTDAFGTESSATVKLFVASGILYVDNTAAPGGDGSLAAPFNTLQGAENTSAEGNAIFLFTGNGTSSGYRQGIDLRRDQLLLGQSSPLSLFDQATGQLTELPTGAPENRPIISDTDTQDFATAIILEGNNVIRGLQVGSMSAPQINSKGMFGREFGLLYMREVSFANSRSYMIDLRTGTVDAVVDSITNPNSNTADAVQLNGCAGDFEVTGKITANQGISVGGGTVNATFNDVELTDPHSGIFYVTQPSGSFTLASNGGGLRNSTPTTKTGLQVIQAVNFSLKSIGSEPFEILNVGSGTSTGETGLFIEDSDNVELENIKLSGGTLDSDKGISILNSDNVSVSNSFIDFKNGTGIQVGSLDGERNSTVTINNNTINGTSNFNTNLEHGISVIWGSNSGSAIDIDISGNNVIGASERSIELAFTGNSGTGSQKSLATVHNNRVFDTFRDAIYFEGQGTAKAKAVITENQLDGLVNFPLALRGGSFDPDQGVRAVAAFGSELDLVVQGNTFQDFEREAIEIETRFVDPPLSGTIRALVDSNTITDGSLFTSRAGIATRIGGINGSDRIDATIVNNTIDVSSPSISAVVGTSSTPSGASASLCVSISGNSSDGATAPPEGRFFLDNFGLGSFSSVGGTNLGPSNNGVNVSSQGVIGNVASCAAVQ